MDEFGGSEATAAGFLQAARELGFEGVPLIHARTGPIGTITKDAFDRIVGEMIDMLRENGPWDGVLLANHGRGGVGGVPGRGRRGVETCA